MEQERIGKFIQDLRKEKNLTQKELAEKLGITDRAISKWENSRGMPEVSLMKPLCDILGITVSELLSGERIAQKDYREKSEFRFLDAIEITDKKIKQKNTLLRTVVIAAVLLLITGIMLVYLIPFTRGYFRADEEIGIFWVNKTLPVAPYGEELVRYDYPRDFVEQDITEKIDLEQLESLLPLMRITVYDEALGRHWVGDVTYEIFGSFKNGSRAGRTFCIELGDGPTNYLQHHARNRRYDIIEPDAWLEIMEMLEGWDAPHREYFQWEKENVFSIFYQGQVYKGQGMLLPLPEDALWLDSVRGISAKPDEELECSFGTQGNQVYLWQADGQTYLAVQVAHDKAYGIPIATP